MISVKQLVKLFGGRKIKQIYMQFHAPAPTKDYKISYSQCGEDIIVDFFFNVLHLDSITYLDVGANHPSKLNNTFFFYEKGCRGVCIEPDPSLLSELQKYRPRDIHLNVGVGIDEQLDMEFYVMSDPTLNTFSREEAQRIEAFGHYKINQVVKVPVLSINHIISSHFSVCPDYLSLDVEGLDLLVLQNLDFSKHRPKVCVVETVQYTPDGTGKKLVEIISFMASNGYSVYADTYINTIFIDEALLTRSC